MEILYVTFYSYICGSIPFGLVLTKIFTNKDLRKVGSGNIGATNVLRTGNKLIAAFTLLLDIFKGYFPVIVSLKYFPDLVYLSCLFAFLGHMLPIWLKFNGGKGVATFLGILIALSLQLSFLFIFTWLVIFLIFRYSSVSSIFSCLTVLVVNFLRDLAYTIEITLTPSQIIDSKILFIFFILILFTHRKNIYNLKNKIEPKIKI